MNCLKSALIILLAFTLLSASTSVVVDTTIHKNSNDKRVYHTIRTDTPPKIDGKLDDACWETGTWSGKFLQQMPTEGEAPTDATEMQILYDDKNIYVAFRIHDDRDKIDVRLSRRDNFAGDMIGIALDSYNTQRTAYEFDLTAAGGKVDLILSNEDIDLTWDPIWTGKVELTDWGWTAEMEIPLSQLRYNKQDEQVWGLHAWRWINRNWEEDQWALIPRDTPGRLYDIGELHGVKNLPKNKRFELVPYVRGQVHAFPKEEGNPFATGSETDAAIGLDGKFGLSSDFTVDFTINPDFGQVEADPAVLNLSNFETFYQEKRPFFLEGNDIFEFDYGDNSLFYSRRIGSRPHYTPDLEDGEYASMPENTSILGAAKVTGKTKNGLSIGVLESVTAAEKVEIDTPGRRYKQTAEPMSNFFVTRLQKEWNQGNTRLGGIMTAVNRRIEDDHLNFLNRKAYTGGFDFKQFFRGKTYYIESKGVFSQIEGDAEAIERLQNASTRYFQRPDVDHVKYDSTRTKLAGHGLRLQVGKSGGGHWRFFGYGVYRSPGLELNDIGYQREADEIEQGVFLSYEENVPQGIFRTYAISVSQENAWDFDGTFIDAVAGLYFNGQFKNKWHLFYRVLRHGDQLDNRVLRGGPAMKIEGHYCNNARISTDHSKDFIAGFGVHYHIHDDADYAKNLGLFPWVSWRMTSNLSLEAEFDYSANLDPFQYVQAEEFNGATKYLMASLDRETIGMTLRFDLAITPEFTIQYYGNPYISLGQYDSFKHITNSRSHDYFSRYHELNDDMVYSKDDNTYRIQDGDVSYEIDNPDFNFREFRSNLVARWEYRPGSTLYLVWTHGRSAWESITGDSFSHNVNSLFDYQSDNVFLLKWNYWFSL